MHFLKKLKSERVTACCLAFLMVYGAFLGTKQFGPEKEEIDNENIESVAVSLDKTAPPFEVNAKAALLMDADTGTVLYSYNENDRLPPASVTKVMTILLVLEAVDSGKISLDDEITISENAASMGGSQMYMEPGEVHTLEEVMKGIAMVSANDGCVAVAEHLSGSVDIFVENMNKKAESLGMKNTHFINTNGLPAEDHYSSAYDIALMSRELLKHTEEHEWFTTWQDKVEIGLPGKETEFGLTNTNKLIRQYKGAIGIKTGYTSEAGYCLSGAAEREGTKLIAVVLGCESTNVRLQEITKLLDFGFANYETLKIADKNEKLGAYESIKGNPEIINAVTLEEISLLIDKGSKDKVTTEIVIEEDIKMPVEKGEVIGEIIVKNDGKEVGRYDLVSKEDMKRAGPVKIAKRLIEKATDGDEEKTDEKEK